MEWRSWGVGMGNIELDGRMASDLNCEPLTSGKCPNLHSTREVELGSGMDGVEEDGLNLNEYLTPQNVPRLQKSHMYAVINSKSNGLEKVGLYWYILQRAEIRGRHMGYMDPKMLNMIEKVDR
ncbi:hypothetical protein OCU04_006881 [Sclerotinia nivalis]|uniref:Uncharacterized protein n=1 Tax=Sclerotinia nivalis TaxID=352851 RepID=A0A9X0AKP7_9HELO|nr:hypothetical protein OCU04_006881 [Sclerotinia nivalis]